MPHALNNDCHDRGNGLMSHRDHKEPNEFSQKMRNEGKAGFGAGPWSDPAKIGVKTRPAVAPPVNTPARRGSSPVQSDKHPPCRLGDRILTGLAIMSLGMLITGAMGAYLSHDSPRVATTTRSESAAATELTESRDERFVELERKLTQLSDYYGGRLRSLETKIAQTVEPYEARLTKVESRLEASGDPGIPQEQFTVSSYEARLSALENRLEQGFTPYHAELRDMENRMGQGNASHEARLRDIEGRLMQIQIPYEQRLKALEQQLIYASARLDHLSAEMESLIDNNTTIIEASADIQSDPPAALPVAVSSDVPADNTGSQSLQPASMVNAAVADTYSGSRVVPAPESMPNEVARAAGSQASTATARDIPPTGKSTPGLTKAPEAGGMKTPPTVIAHAEAPQTPARPVETAREIRQESPPHQTGTGNWVINIASYASESIAARKQADFESKGVTAEQSVASVNGKTIYRVRITGFDTRKAATVRAKSVRQQLGLKETWITRQ
jgi:predicted component of type VI protein secretion system